MTGWVKGSLIWLAVLAILATGFVAQGTAQEAVFEARRAIVHDVVRHRLTLSYEAQGEGVTPDRVVDEIVTQVALT